MSDTPTPDQDHAAKTPQEHAAPAAAPADPQASAAPVRETRVAPAPGSAPAPSAGAAPGPQVAGPAAARSWWPVLRWLLLVPVWKWIGAYLLAPLIGSSSPDEVVLFRFSKAIYTWPIAVVGLLGSRLVAWGLVSDSVMSWAFNLTIFVVLVAIMYDMPRNRFIVVLLSLAFVVLALWLVQTKTTLAPLTWLKDFFVGMDPRLDIGGARMLSWLMIPLLVLAVVHARLDGKLRITYNEIEFYKFGDVTDSVTRFGKRIKLRVADYLEVLPGLGGGSLVIMSDDGEVIEQINDLVAIVPRWPRINAILETWQTRELQDPAAKVAQL